VIEAFANNCVVLGQFGGHQLRVTCTSIVGGKCSTASGTYSFVGGGCCNTASGLLSFVGGGRSNTASGYGTFVGGLFNGATGNGAFIGGGNFNCAGACNATIVGGNNNSACATLAFIGGGFQNSNSSYRSFLGGGSQNSISGGYNSFIGGGISNCSNFSSLSSILGGRNNCNSFGCNTHIIGSCIVGNATNWTFVNNLCQVGGGISDRRTKNTICDTGYRLCDIVKLRPVSYCWNHDPSNSKKYGFIAQEVQEAIPDIVDYNEIEKVDKDGKRTIFGEGDPVLQFDREAIYASYVNGFKELKAENDALKAKIEAIEEILKRNNLV
jgi:hypothetical protein